jgi:lysophospholipase L1-like esterase
MLLVPPPLHFQAPQPLHQPDPELGWVMRPSQRSFTIGQPVRTNRMGFRSPEIQPAKPPGTFRVLCLGDSQTFGNGVPQDRTFPRRLEGLLRDEGLDGAQVINAGVQAYDTEQEVRLLERLAPRLDPDVVVLAFYLNDFADVLRPPRTASVDPETGEFVFGGVKSYVPYGLIYAVKRSRVFTLVSTAYHQWVAAQDPPLSGEILAGEESETFRRAVSRIRELLAQAGELASRRGFRFLVVIVPTAMEFRDPSPDSLYRPVVREVATELSLDVIDPTPGMQDEGITFETGFIAWDGHMSAVSHDAVARALAAPILAEASVVPR